MAILSNEDIVSLEVAVSERDSVGIFADFVCLCQSLDVFRSRIKAMSRSWAQEKIVESISLAKGPII